MRRSIRKVELHLLNCDTDNLAGAVDIVKKSGVIAYPTDTLYGLGCNPFDGEAVGRVIRLKKRGGAKPLPVLCSDIRKAEELVHLGEVGRRLASGFWPGGLTIVGKISADNLPAQLTGGSEGLGVRIPDNLCALKIISLCGGCLVGTSANISGCKTPDDVEGVVKMFGGGLDAVIYGGSRPAGVQSTVVDVVGGVVKIVREGVVPVEALLKISRLGGVIVG